MHRAKAEFMQLSGQQIVKEFGMKSLECGVLISGMDG